MLSNAYFLAKFRFDRAENEPAKIFAKFCRILPPEVSIPAMAGDAFPSFAAESIALDLRLSLRPACPPPSGPAAPAWILACASPAERYGGSQLDVRNYEEL